MSATLNATIPHQVEIPLSGTDIAKLFWQLDNFQQADFFNRLWEFEKLPFQLQAVTDSENLNLSGRLAMEKIGEYSWKQD